MLKPLWQEPDYAKINIVTSLYTRTHTHTHTHMRSLSIPPHSLGKKLWKKVSLVYCLPINLYKYIISLIRNMSRLQKEHTSIYVWGTHKIWAEIPADACGQAARHSKFGRERAKRHTHPMEEWKSLQSGGSSCFLLLVPMLKMLPV
jgi:hypothetical protein